MSNKINQKNIKYIAKQFSTTINQTSNEKEIKELLNEKEFLLKGNTLFLIYVMNYLNKAKHYCVIDFFTDNYKRMKF